jgi:hypothetical protein
MKRVPNLMKKTLLLLGILMPVACFAQVTITGRVLNQADTKPVANASVFLNNTTFGDQTTTEGAFTVHNVKPGKYDLVISIIGFETYEQPIVVGYNDLDLHDITVFPKAIGLKEVKIKSHNDPHLAADLEMFKREFLGTSVRARECKILNPQVLNVEYNDTTSAITASSDDFLDIENDALGYRIKYKLTKFLLQVSDGNRKNVFFQGPVFFTEMKGTPSQQNTWEINRQNAYDNSPMHFLRAALANKLGQEGFRVQQYAIYANPERPADSLINRKIKFYKSLKSLSSDEKDSLALWNKRSKLPPILEKLMPWPLFKPDIIEPTSRPGAYLLNCDNDGLYVDFSKTRKYRSSDNINQVYNDYNEENTLIKFNGSNALFDGNGIIFDLGAVSFMGAWGKNRVAELLPYDFTPLQNNLQASDDQHVVASLEKYLADHPVEKAYLQFDKPYYATGDTIYFKAYVTAGEQHKLSGLSGVLHVELINTKNKVDQSIQLQLDSGLATGDFALPDSLPAGNYRVRAYTRWMRNFGEAAFFDRTIRIGSTKPGKVPESLAKQPARQSLKPDVQFFPEGGAMVAGVKSKVAFKAIGANGMGIGVKGSIIDNDNNDIVRFESAHLGMGYFYLVPANGKTYKAKIAYPDGTQDLVELPKAGAGGLTLSVDDDSIPKATVRIATGADYYRQNQGKTYTLVIYSQGSATTVNCKLDSAVIKLDILKRRLHTGVATVTLFSAENEPLAERLLFIQNYDQLSLNVAGDKGSYAKREKVTIKLNALNRRGDPSTGHFSVAVTNQSKMPEAGNNADNILTNLLLTSDLKGYIEQPGYFFADTGPVTRQNLDVLMLTQGFRRFEWKQVLDTAILPIKYSPETGIEVAGQVSTLSNKPVAKGTVTLLQPNGALFLNSRTDEKGLFRFLNLVFTDTVQYVLSAVDASGKNSTKISYSPEKLIDPLLTLQPQQPEVSVADSAFSGFINNEKANQEAILSKFNGKQIALKEVKVHDKKTEEPYHTQSMAGVGNADQILHADQIGYGPSLSSMLNGKLHGIIINHGIPVSTISGVMSVYLDGVRMAIEPKASLGIDIVNPGDVETVEVLTSAANTSIYGSDGGHGVLVITTKQGGGTRASDIVAMGVLPIKVAGFYKAREFYAPKYEKTQTTGAPADLRSTIYWNPELKTDATGNASFNYYNADGTGNYKVIIEGIDKDGNIGRQVFEYKVE